MATANLTRRSLYVLGRTEPRLPRERCKPEKSCCLACVKLRGYLARLRGSELLLFDQAYATIMAANSTVHETKLRASYEKGVTQLWSTSGRLSSLKVARFLNSKANCIYASEPFELREISLLRNIDVRDHAQKNRSAQTEATKLDKREHNTSVSTGRKGQNQPHSFQM